MATKKVDVVEPEAEVIPHVTVNLDIDPNDPRNLPAVDGAKLPVVDINVPIKGVKEAA